MCKHCEEIENEDYYELKIKSMIGLTIAVNKINERFKGSRLWWRGQWDSNWDLTPWVYREPYKKSSIEKMLIGHFRLTARVRYDKECPEKDDYFSWLSLAQHYRLPTRLLDWTESLMIASYFSVCENPDTPGAIWGLEPQKLNEVQTRQPFLRLPNDDIVKYLSIEAFEKSYENIRKKKLYKKKRKEMENDELELVERFLNDELKELYTKLEDDVVIAVKFEHFDLRHLIQSSVFTIHGTYNPLNKIPNTDEFLVKINITPNLGKGRILSRLREYGINESYIYPDLEHLTKHLRNKFCNF